jgi:hypothetical protein
VGAEPGFILIRPRGRYFSERKLKTRKVGVKDSDDETQVEMDKKTIAGGTGSDQLQCDGCGLDVSVVVYFNDHGKAFGDCCATSAVKQLVGSIMINPRNPENPIISRFRIFSAAEKANPHAVLGTDEDPLSPRNKKDTKENSHTKETKQKFESQLAYRYALPKWTGRNEEENKNHLLNGYL